MQPARVAIDYWLRPIPPEEMPRIAAELLAGGYDTPALGEAAGLAASGDPREIREVFQEALVQLGVWIPGHEHALAREGRRMARDLATGRISMTECAARIRRIWDLDEVIYHELPTDMEEFVLLCHLRGAGDIYDDRGGDERLLAAATSAARENPD
jgi:hypothetical protein